MNTVGRKTAAILIFSMLMTAAGGSLAADDSSFASRSPDDRHGPEIIFTGRADQAGNHSAQ